IQRLDQLRHSGSLGLRGSHSRAVSRLLSLHVLPYLSGGRLCVRRLRWFGLLDRPLVCPSFLPVFHRLFFRYAARPPPRRSKTGQEQPRRGEQTFFSRSSFPYGGGYPSQSLPLPQA